MRSVGVLVAHPDPGIVDELIHAIEAEGDLYLALDPTKAAVVLAGVEALEGVTTKPPPAGTAVVGLAANGDLAAVSRAALRSRAQEIVCWPQDRAHLRQILRDAASRARLDARHADGRLIAVAGARGGSGTTTVAAMMSRAIEAVVVDLDPIGAGQRAFLAEGAEPTLGTVMAAVDDLDPTALAAAFTPHAAGVALCGESRSGAATAGQASRLATLLRASTQVAVFDVGRAVDDAARSAISGVDATVVVCAPDVASMRGAQILLDGTGTHVVLNRAARGGVSARDASRVLGRQPAAVVPADGRVRRAGEAGRLPKRGPARRAIDGFARRLLEELRDGS